MSDQLSAKQRIEENTNLGLVMAIAFTLASKKLQKHTGVAAEDWQKELLEQAVRKFNTWSLARIQRFTAENYE